MKHLSIIAVLVTFLAACTSDEAPAPPAAPAPAAPAGVPAAKKPAGKGGDPMAMSEAAYKGAMEACKGGCENPPACQQALLQALHATNAALTEPSEDSASLKKSAADAEVLRTRFDGIAKLSQGCVRRAESAPKKPS